MSENYIHINEAFQLEVCNVSNLVDNVLNGYAVKRENVLEGSVQDFINSVRAVYDEYSCKFVVTSLDPFLLSERHIEYISKLEYRKGAIVCDTHHGVKPLTNLIRFIEKTQTSAVLMRFNQRHCKIIRKTGAWCKSTVFSPDLKILFQQIQAKPQLQSNKIPEGIFVGGRSSAHKARNIVMSRLDRRLPQFTIRRTKTTAEMIDAISNFSWSLNITLNGDFNRRIIESLMGTCACIADYVPSSQYIGPFKRLRPYILDVIPFGIKTPEKLPGAKYLQEVGQDGFHALSELMRSNYDQGVLEEFHSAILEGKSVRVDKRYLDEVHIYEEYLCSSARLECTRRPEELLAEDIAGFEMVDEFSRLYRYLQHETC